MAGRRAIRERDNFCRLLQSDPLLPLTALARKLALCDGGEAEQHVEHYVFAVSSSEK